MQTLRSSISGKLLKVSNGHEGVFTRNHLANDSEENGSSYQWIGRSGSYLDERGPTPPTTEGRTNQVMFTNYDRKEIRSLAVVAHSNCK